jgi:hypothetical protein
MRISVGYAAMSNSKRCATECRYHASFCAASADPFQVERDAHPVRGGTAEEGVKLHADPQAKWMTATNGG